MASRPQRFPPAFPAHTSAPKFPAAPKIASPLPDRHTRAGAPAQTAPPAIPKPSPGDTPNLDPSARRYIVLYIQAHPEPDSASHTTSANVSRTYRRPRVADLRSTVKSATTPLKADSAAAMHHSAAPGHRSHRSSTRVPHSKISENFSSPCPPAFRNLRPAAPTISQTPPSSPAH